MLIEKSEHFKISAKIQISFNHRSFKAQFQYEFVQKVLNPLGNFEKPNKFYGRVIESYVCRHSLVFMHLTILTHLTAMSTPLFCKAVSFIFLTLLSEPM